MTRFDRIDTPAERAVAVAEYVHLRDSRYPAWSTECVRIAEAVREYDQRQPRQERAA